MFVKHKNSKKAQQGGSVFIETLETRQMMSNNSGMWDADVNPHREAPPAIVEYAQPSNPDASLPVNPTTNVANESRSISIYNSTWGGPSFGRDVYWAAAAGWSTPQGYDFSRKQTEILARLARDGGQAINMRKVVSPGSMTVLDFEDRTLTRKSPAFVADRLKWFKQAAPDVKVGVFGLTIFPEASSEDVAAMNANTKAYLTRKIMEYRAVYDNSDFICYDVYMLHPKDVDRDLKCHMEITKLYRELFPDKPIIPFAWGVYHDAWNPLHSVLSDDVMARYAQSLAADNDAVMLWGEYDDNAKLLEYLQRPGARVMPTDRKANWANEPTVQDPTLTGARPSGGASSGSTGSGIGTGSKLTDGIFDDEGDTTLP